MQHLDDGALRAHVDGQLDQDGARHLERCSECRARLAEVVNRSSLIQTRLRALDAQGREPTSAGAAWRRFQNEYQKKETSMWTSLRTRLRPLLLTGLGIAAIAAAFSFTPVQQAFSQFLALFRVQQVATLPIDFSRFDSVAFDNNSAAMRRASQALADSVEIRSESDLLETVTDTAQASELAGYTVRVGDGPVVQHVVRGGTEFVMKLSAIKAQSILTDLGRPDLTFPAAADGAALTVNIPTAVSTAYGECPRLASQEERRSPVADENCILLQQMPSPSVTSDKPFDPSELAALALQFAGMDSEEAVAISQQFDWATTLVVPLPSEGAVSQDVSVDGVTGKLITAAGERGPDTYSIVWVKDGFLYAVIGAQDADAGLALANSLK
ncbi:MAG: hypothetical protein JNL73_07170 [Anaerolineales bacterium]|nr:hypothetical protein [Anaerolineales bacterium]